MEGMKFWVYALVLVVGLLFVWVCALASWVKRLEHGRTDPDAEVPSAKFDWTAVAIFVVVYTLTAVLLA